MTEKKRGRPKKIEISVWDKKYYTLDPKRDEWSFRKLKEERLYKGFAVLFTLAFGKEPNQKDVGTINKAVNDTIDRI
jgi:hypothetical protein